ncbi:MAG: von Willebrand factor type A domain-containing protein [Chitinophagales bacterium]
MKQLFILLLSLSALVTSPEGKKTIYGTVTDKSTGKPVAGANVLIKGSPGGTVTDAKGEYKLENLSAGTHSVLVSMAGYKAASKTADLTKVESAKLDFVLQAEVKQNEAGDGLAKETITQTKAPMKEKERTKTESFVGRGKAACPAFGSATVTGNGGTATYGYSANYSYYAAPALRSGSWKDLSSLPDVEELPSDTVGNNDFREVQKNPFSTFSIDVDDGSYSLMRKTVNGGHLPAKDEVRTEEFINYFNYNYPLPKTQEQPFSVYTEMSACPWNPSNQLLHIGIQGYDVVQSQLPPSNLVFLIDVSGSMMSQDKLPLVQKAFNYMVDELTEKDVVSIVVYAGNSGLVLAPTKGNEKQKIKDAINELTAGGSTAGGAGIELAYKTAKANFIADGNNRVILATDGDFNVGISDEQGLIKLIEEKRNDGIFLSVVGCGSGNYQDKKMEQLADHGNGYYGYIDDEAEAKRIFVKQMGATVLTIAKDVKLQLEFNPQWVKDYKLVGYENRILEAEDFANDKKDAGELGGGSSVTALYEVSLYEQPHTDLKPVAKNEKLQYAAFGEKDILALNIRYKDPKEDKSKLITSLVQNISVTPDKTSTDFKFSAAVAMAGMFLKDAKNKGNSNLDLAYAMAGSALGDDKDGYRKEFTELLKKMRGLKPAEANKNSGNND